MLNRQVTLGESDVSSWYQQFSEINNYFQKYALTQKLLTRITMIELHFG